VRRLAGEMLKEPRTSGSHGPTPAAPSGIATFAAVPTERNSTLRPWRLYWDVGRRKLIARTLCTVKAGAPEPIARIARIRRNDASSIGTQSATIARV
jgi:hypothetical protein